MPVICGVWYHNSFTDSDWVMSWGILPRCLSGNNSVVECDLAKVEVAGSNPVSRSNSLIGGVPCTPLAVLHSVSASPLTPFRPLG